MPNNSTTFKYKVNIYDDFFYLKLTELASMNQVCLEHFKEALGNRIKQLRLEAGLTQEQLALRLGYKDKQVVNRYEKKGANPTAYNLLTIAIALKVSVDDLLTSDPPT